MRRYTDEEKQKYCKLAEEHGHTWVCNKYGINRCSLAKWKNPEYRKRCIILSNQWRMNNEKQHALKCKEWQKNNLIRNQELHQKYYSKMKNDITRYNEKKKKDIIRTKEKYTTNDIFREKCCHSTKKYQKNNRHKINMYHKNKMKTDINFHILHNLRSRLNFALKKSIKQESAKELIGCTIEELKIHLANQFVGDMTWDNYGEWHIDHIRPCSSFNMLMEEDRKRCFHYSNLQPLWAEDNFSKGDKIV